MTATEPSTAVTDYLLAVICGCFSLRLRRQTPAERPVRLWGAAFAVIAFAALLGGTWHGIRPVLPPRWQAAIWTATVQLVGLHNLLIAAGSVLATTTWGPRAALLGAVVLKFAVYAVWMSANDAFAYVVLDSAGAMLLLVILHGWSAWNRDDPASRLVLAAVGVSVLAAAVQASGFDLHRHLNHNDIYHLIQVGAMALFFQGGRRLRERAG